MKFYVYGHYDKNGDLRYVGKGTGNRMMSKQSRSKSWRSTFRDYFPIYKILCDNLSEEQALELESLIIQMTNTINCKNHSTTPIEIDFDTFNLNFKYSGTSKSGLVNSKGKEVGTITSDGRWQVSYKGKTYKAHRIIMVLLTGKSIPSDKIVDHIDRNPLNNKIENLRLVTRSENSKNLSFSDNKLKLKHITEVRDGSKVFGYLLQWTFESQSKKEYFSIKKFKTAENALSAVKVKRESLISSGEIYWNQTFDN